jgi:hypothetical protein
MLNPHAYTASIRLARDPYTNFGLLPAEPEAEGFAAIERVRDRHAPAEAQLAATRRPTLPTM